MHYRLQWKISPALFCFVDFSQRRLNFPSFGCPPDWLFELLLHSSESLFRPVSFFLFGVLEFTRWQQFCAASSLLTLNFWTPNLSHRPSFSKDSIRSKSDRFWIDRSWQTRSTVPSNAEEVPHQRFGTNISGFSRPNLWHSSINRGTSKLW
jgi:hypothetical protein